MRLLCTEFPKLAVKPCHLLAHWGSTFKTYLEPLTKLLKRIVRIIMGCNRYAHTAALFQKLELMKVPEIYIYFVQLFMFKYSHSLLPNIFNDFFVKNITIHSHNTRQSYQFHVPVTKNEIRKRTVRYTGVHIMNFFQDKIDHNCTVQTYKKHLKKIILQQDLTALTTN